MSLDKHNFMDRNTELRKLKPAYMGTLVNLLSDCNLLTNVENWKTLLEVVPKELDVLDSAKRYTTDDIRNSLIEKHSKHYNKEPAEVFLQEWSIAGKNRPKLRHLLDSLVTAKLWRAADYVAEKILNESLPKRPLIGPDARVHYPLTSTDRVEIENYLKEKSYPSGLSSNSENQNIDINLNVQNQIIDQPVKHILEKLSTVSCSENASSENISSHNTNNVISNKTISTKVQGDTTSNSTESNQTVQTSISNSGFSSVAASLPPQLPDLLRLLINSAQQPIQDFNQNVESVDSANNELLNVPEISQLLLNNQNSEILPQISDLLSNSQNLSSPEILPIISALLSNRQDLSGQEIRPLISNLLSTSQNSSSPEIIPLISALLSNRQDLSGPENRPLISNLLSNSQNLSNSINIPIISELLSNSQNLPISVIGPAISALLSNRQDLSKSQNLTSSTLNPISNNENFPIFEELLSNQKTKNSSTSLRPSNASFSNHSQNANVLTLPQLELNTKLPHFAYSKIELYTNNFNDDTFLPNDNNSGRYLGSGAFGSVYLAVGLMNQNVAVKRIKLDGDMPIDLIAKSFKNEVEILSKYQHKNLVSLLGYSCDEPTYCLVYEHVCGSSLASKLLSNSNILSWKERIQIAYEISVGISYLHTAYTSPLIHRDVKSENILLTEGNTPKLCDFGLIKLTPDTKTNFTSKVCGTSAYMAPEAFRGDISIKMDTFSFGVVLFELLTSLPSLDDNREEGADLVTYIDSKCENGIGDLLDLRAGTWLYDNIDYSTKIFELANLCIEEKRKRPTMVDVRDQLKNCVDHINSTVEQLMDNYRAELGRRTENV